MINRFLAFPFCVRLIIIAFIIIYVVSHDCDLDFCSSVKSFLIYFDVWAGPLWTLFLFCCAFAFFHPLPPPCFALFFQNICLCLFCFPLYITFAMPIVLNFFLFSIIFDIRAQLCDRNVPVSVENMKYLFESLVLSFSLWMQDEWNVQIICFVEILFLL